MLELMFWGAADTTTGSFHQVRVDGQKLALDCGLFQGKRSEYYSRNIEFPSDPATFHALVLSHAHIDHCGNIPNFVKQGFDGDIYCTHATADLARPMLLDSAYIQAKDVAYVNKKRMRRSELPVQPLYTPEDVEESFPKFVGVGYYRWFRFAERVSGKFLEAGHILGSAQVELDIDLDGGRVHRLAFSGDIGRGSKEILRDPDIPSEVDTLIMESTYGDRESPASDNLQEQLKHLVDKVSQRSGKLIIPSFSVGRTQEIVYHLNLLFNAGELPRLPIFVDSPLSTNVTEIFRNHPECFNRETRDHLRKDDDIFGFDSLTYITSVEDSMKLNDINHACVIISASGMCEAGRILHHLRNSIQHPRNCVLFVGYQAENTLGRRLLDGEKKVRIFGEEHQVRCEIASMLGFSGHADASELRDYAFHVEARSGGRLKRIFLVHGEESGRQVLAEYLRKTLKVEVFTPKRGDVWTL